MDEREICIMMATGKAEEILVLEACCSKRELAVAMHRHPDYFDEKSWLDWHLRLFNITPCQIPPLPRKKPGSPSASMLHGRRYH